MKKSLIFLIILTVTVSSFAQTREDISVYIPPVLSLRPDHAAFFQENFSMETTAAGYTVANTAREADYTLKMETKTNMILYDDGTEEEVNPDTYYVDEETGEIVREKQFNLQLNLIRNEDNVEIVAFSFPFSTLDEMYDFNLYLLYEAMANVPLTKLGIAAPDDERWRNKWIYLRASFEGSIPFYLLKPDGLKYPDQTAIFPKDPSKLPANYPMFEKIDGLVLDLKPAVTVGLELQYMYAMSTEVDFLLRFGDPLSATSEAFTPTIQILQKFPLKPGRIFMVEPYGLVALPMSTSPDITIPQYMVGGGVQFGVRGGPMGAFFADVSATFAFEDVVRKNSSLYYDYPSQLHYSHFIMSIGIGYKIGFFDRRMPKWKRQE